MAREPPNIPVEALRACLRERYAIAGGTPEFLDRGHDYQASVFRVVSALGDVYLLKVTSRPLYEPGLTIPRYLHDQGLEAVVAPIPTTSGALWTALAEWRVIVYPFLTGDTSLTGMTDHLWRETGAIIGRLHQVEPPPEGLASLRQETFDPGGYLRWIRDFETQHLPALEARRDAQPSARVLCESWRAHQPAIHHGLAYLERLGTALQAAPPPYVICHADLHAANLLRDPAGHVFVLDWDEVMLAPKERDFIFIREPAASAFWDGYGPHARDTIDWSALTYFCWERVIQDLIEEAEQAVFRDDVGEEARTLAAWRFAATFAPGSNVDAARAASAHLPANLNVPDTPRW